MAKKWVELSQPWFVGMPTCPDHGEVSFTVAHGPLSLESGPSESSVTHIRMAAHVGTHIDAARHFLSGAKTIDQYPLERFVGPAVVVDVRRSGAVEVSAKELESAAPAIQRGESVLLCFGWAERFRDESYHVHPYLSKDAADFLVQAEINLLGTDTVSPDLPIPVQPPDYQWPVHGRLLGNDILIIENLGVGLKELLGQRVTLVAAPLRIEGAEGSPLAAMALVEDE